MNEPRDASSLQEYRARIGAAWLDVRAFLADRRRILAEPAITLDPAPPLAYTPLRFAGLLSVALPTLLAGIVAVVLTTIRPAAPGPLDEQAAGLAHARAELRRAFGEPSGEPVPVDDAQRAVLAPFAKPRRDLAMAFDAAARTAAADAFTREVDALAVQPADAVVRSAVVRLDRDLARNERATRLMLRMRDSGAHDLMVTMAAGLTLLLNGVIFRALVRRRRTLLPHADAADRVLLYYLTARQLGLMLLLIAVVSLARAASLWGDRELVQFAGLAYLGVLVALPVHAYFACAPAITRVLSGDAAPVRGLVRFVGRRILLCFLLSSLAVGVLGVIAGASAAIAGQRFG